MKMYKRLALHYSYEPIKRSRDNVAYIVIHFTGNKNDTAKNNADFFATGNTRNAGAHFFVDSTGKIARSVTMNRIARAVGGFYSNDDKAAQYYKKCTNANSVSVELCNAVSSYTEAQASTHVLEVAEKLCDKVAIIKSGKLIRSGVMDAVKGDDSLEDVFLELEGETC